MASAFFTEQECSKKNKVVVILGATGAGKTKLSIDLATRFSGEIINSDKIQVHKGLNITCNRVTPGERKGIPHHLLGVIDPDVDFTTQDFVARVHDSIDVINSKGRLPIIVGGSNSYVEALIEGHHSNFKSQFDLCFLWIDIRTSVLYRIVEDRVDHMINSGLVNEVRDFIDVVEGSPKDFSRGIWKAIGVAELQDYLKMEKGIIESSEKVESKDFLVAGINKIKENTCKLVDKQLEKIQRLRDVNGWNIRRIDATWAVSENNDMVAVSSWDEVVLKPSFQIVGEFLEG